MRSLPRRLLLSVAGALMLGACLAPTLPLPPPSEPTVDGPDENGVTTLSGKVEGGAWVYAINRGSDQGAFEIAGDDGLYSLTLITQAGDRIQMWYTVGAQTSDQLEFEIQGKAAGEQP
jgi:hypothetical protein